jgi:phospholipase DDHD1
MIECIIIMIYDILQIDHFFAFGSPTALFIAMKEYETLVSKDHQGAESFLPSCVCKRIHNMQHPSDPIVREYLCM